MHDLKKKFKVKLENIFNRMMTKTHPNKMCGIQLRSHAEEDLHVSKCIVEKRKDLRSMF